MSLSGLLNNVQGISNLTQAATDIAGRLESGSYWSQLKPASYKGVPFVVLSGGATMGRRNAVHEYPFRDDAWVEDLGRQARRINISGFLIGDDVIAQRARLIAKLEEKGDGDLVHPTLGKRKVAVLSFNVSEAMEEGRVFRFSLACIEQGARKFPASTSSGQQAVGAAAGLSKLEAAKAYAQRAVSALKAGASAANEAARQASAWAAQAQQYARDATSLVNLAKTVPGEFGRLVGQTLGVRAGQKVPKTSDRSTDDLKGIAAQSRATVAASSGSLSDAGADLGPTSTSGFSTAAQAMATTVRTQASTPGDALVALGQLAVFQATGTTTGASLTAQTETVLLLQRAAVVEMAIASASYQPASSADAQQVRDLVCAALQVQMDLAGERGDDAVYLQLRELRASVILDLNARGAALPELVQVSMPASLPSLVVAQRLYQDGSREAELVQRVRPVHPAFMPVTFKALNA